MPTKDKKFTKPGTSFVIVATSDDSNSPIQLSDLQSLLNQLISSSSALAVSPGNRWLLDSACCNHTTSDFSLMSTSSPTKSLHSIYVADGNCMNIPHTHTGTIDTPNLHLPQTYYVPNLTFNLVSVSQLCDLGLTVSFSPNGCLVHDLQTGRTIGTGCKVGRLFELISLQLPSSSSIFAPVTESDRYQWHLCLGHASSEKLRHLILLTI